MALFVLRTGYRVETMATGGRVVHLRTGDALDLSAAEVQLLARAMAGGVDPSEPGLRPVVRKMASLGLLVPSGATAPTPPTASGAALDLPLDLEAPDLESDEASPQRLEANAEVPLLRSDLLLGPATSGQVTVRDPRTGRSAALHEFEISLARMFDGRRPISEVMLAAQRLGIPTSLESLGQFVRQLDRLGFLVADPAAPAPSAHADGTTWQPRAKWDDGTRVLFQTGLRLARRGRYPEAARYFEALLSKDPGNVEARRWLDKVTRRSTPQPVPTASGPAPGNWLVSPETFQGPQSPDGFAAATFTAPEVRPAAPLENVMRARSDRDATRRFSPIQLRTEPPTEPELPAASAEEGTPAVDDIHPLLAEAPLKPLPEGQPGALAPESDTAEWQLPSPDSAAEAAEAASGEFLRFPDFDIPPLNSVEAALGDDSMHLEPLPEPAPVPLPLPAPEPEAHEAHHPVPEPEAPHDAPGPEALEARHPEREAPLDAPREAATDLAEQQSANEPERPASSGPLELDLTSDATPAAPSLEIESLFFEKETPLPATLAEVPAPTPTTGVDSPLPSSTASMPETSGAESQPVSPEDLSRPLPRAPARSRGALAVGLGVAVALGIGVWVYSRPSPAVKLEASAPERTPEHAPTRPDPGPSALSTPRPAQAVAPRPGAQVDANGRPPKSAEPRSSTAGGASPSPTGVRPQARPPVAAPGAVATERSLRWTEARLIRRGRVTMGELKALVGGTVSWQARPQQRVKAGEPIGLLRASRAASAEALDAQRRLAGLEEAAKTDPSQRPALEAERRKIASLEKERAGDVPLKAPKAGLLMPAIADRATCKAGDKLAAVVYHEAYLVAIAAGAKPEQNWECRIADSSLKQSEPCHVVSAAPAPGGWTVTATTAALWIDAAPSASMELAPSASGRPGG